MTVAGPRGVRRYHTTARRRAQRGPDRVVLRPLASHEDFQQCLALQDRTWGAQFSERASVAMLMGAQKVGGVAAGVFHARRVLLGFVFGLNGVRDGRLAHWSYMLAVRRDVQGQGLGRQLKMYQRQLLLEAGIDVAYWSYDPLVAANGHLNLCRLGARPIEYVRDMYGRETGSALHRDLGTDRFLVEWRLRDPRVEAILRGGPALDGPDDETARAADDLARRHSVAVEIPDDIHAIRARAPAEAVRWRRITRRALRHYLGRGFAVTGWRRGNASRRSAYLLTRN